MTAYRNLADDELLDLLKSGDAEAYQEIYHRYWAMLFRHAKRMLSNDEEAKDIIQDLFVVLWQKAADLSIQRTLSSYLYGVLRYKVFDVIDKRKVRDQHLQSLENFMTNGECTTDDTVRQNELSRLIEREVNKLPSKMREAYELSRNSHFSYEQIGRRMDISDQTVKKQVYNALKILRLRLSSVCLILIFLMQ